MLQHQVTTMKGTSKVIMGATLVMVLTLALVLSLLLLLLAHLYCSLLLRRRRRRHITTTIPNIASSPSHTQQQHSPPPFSNIYSHGVLQIPKIQEQHLSQLHQELANASTHCIGLESFMARTPTMQVQQDSLQRIETIDKTCNGGEHHHLVYISNPIYENEESELNTPFETPDTSPSRLERRDSSSDDDDVVIEVSHCGVETLPSTPFVTPMKKLLHHEEEPCSVCLSDSHSNNVLSFSSSASLSTSPSW